MQLTCLLLPPVCDEQGVFCTCCFTGWMWMSLFCRGWATPYQVVNAKPKAEV